MKQETKSNAACHQPVRRSKMSHTETEETSPPFISAIIQSIVP